MQKHLSKLAFASTLLAVCSIALPAVAAKSTTSGAQKYAWHLSGAVMPVPPYGSMDIPGSDTASKLIVNQPAGKALGNITGVMGGLTPNTTYTVYLSNVYSPFVDNGWSIAGNWDFGFMCSTGCPGGPYVHNVVLAQAANGTLTGSGSSGGYNWVIDSGAVTGGTNVSFTAHYTATADAADPVTVMHVTGIVAPDGTMSGTWDDNYAGGSRTGTWSTSTGTAVHNLTGDTSWTGLLTPTVQPFTFTTDGSGKGSWHVTLKGTNTTGFSAWVNAPGATILVSDSISFN